MRGKSEALCLAVLVFVDTYFLINWLDDPDGDDLYDVVNSKLVVPPDGIDILDVVPSSVCKVAYSGLYYKAKVLETGMCMYVHELAVGKLMEIVLPNSS